MRGTDDCGQTRSSATRSDKCKWRIGAQPADRRRQSSRLAITEAFAAKGLKACAADRATAAAAPTRSDAGQGKWSGRRLLGCVAGAGRDDTATHARARSQVHAPSLAQDRRAAAATARCSAKPARRRAAPACRICGRCTSASGKSYSVQPPQVPKCGHGGPRSSTPSPCGRGWGEGAGQPNADSPVCARPRISACTSCVPS